MAPIEQQRRYPVLPSNVNGERGVDADGRRYVRSNVDHYRPQSDRRSWPGMVVKLLALLLLVAGLVDLWQNVGEPAACRVAEQRVYQRHPMVFGAMKATGGLSFTCSSSSLFAYERVAVAWSVAGTTVRATYVVPLAGAVVAADGGARAIDTASQYGAVALAVLAGKH